MNFILFQRRFDASCIIFKLQVRTIRITTKQRMRLQGMLVYKFKCDLCDADYFGYTCRHLHQRIDEHKGSVVGIHA